ncbi:MAG: alkaline phosphatase family protein [Xanthomonadales bacterium]|nr:alkaline phosphatase family protein [Xanthomonadales bacterium]
MPNELGRGAIALALAWLLNACALPTTAGGPDRQPGHPLILISLDGFHPDYLDRGLSPRLQALADEGVRARWMNPSFPSKTFPNHYTMVTGLRPDRHGIVDNNMVDPKLGRFALHDRAAVSDGRWWGGEPLWIGAARAGLRSATLFWPGSEAAIGGRRPDRWLPYDAAMTMPDRVDQVLAWLALPAPRRPHLVTLYLEAADATGHLYGPDSAQLDAALVALDNALGRLLDGLEGIGLDGRVNLVIVSDHGMAQVDPERTLVLEDLVDPALVEIVSLSELLSFNPRPGRTAEAEAALLAPREGLSCHRRSETPDDWRFGSHPRVPAIVCLLDEGWRVRRRERFNPWQDRTEGNRGAHGFDPASPAMRALFVAQGPDLAAGLLAEPFDNVHVYPLLAALLGIAPAPGDGDPAVTAAMLR